MTIKEEEKRRVGVIQLKAQPAAAHILSAQTKTLSQMQMVTMKLKTRLGHSQRRNAERSISNPAVLQIMDRFEDHSEETDHALYAFEKVCFERDMEQPVKDWLNAKQAACCNLKSDVQIACSR